MPQAPNDTDINDPRPASPIVPVRLGPNDKFQFNCHPGVACFNACCKNIDIQLMPYDIVRLKQRLGITSREFLAFYTQPHAMDGHGMPGVKMKTKEDSAECQFLTPEGCGVYEDRPSACRYYALGLTSMRKKEAVEEENSYFVVKETHCLGHFEPKTQTVAEYRQNQGLALYDDLNQAWRQVVLKKRSAGPTIGRPSDRSFDLFFTASYDVDGLRRFVQSEGFAEICELEPEYFQQLMSDDVALMQFGFRLLKQVLFGEKSFAIKPDAMEKRLARRREQAAEPGS